MLFFFKDKEMYLCHQILIMDLSTIVILVIIGLLAGLLSGVIGIGGGLIMIPLMMMILGMDQLTAQGTS